MRTCPVKSECFTWLIFFSPANFRLGGLLVSNVSKGLCARRAKNTRGRLVQERSNSFETFSVKHFCLYCILQMFTSCQLRSFFVVAFLFPSYFCFRILASCSLFINWRQAANGPFCAICSYSRLGKETSSICPGNFDAEVQFTAVLERGARKEPKLTG